MRVIRVVDMYALALVTNNADVVKADGGERGAAYKVVAPFPVKVFIPTFNVGMLTEDEMAYVNKHAGFVLTEYPQRMMSVWWYPNEFTLRAAWTMVTDRFAR